MAAKMYYDKDADLELIRAKKVAIIGTDRRDTRTR
jgi:ketol-acid reductoisomerase